MFIYCMYFVVCMCVRAYVHAYVCICMYMRGYVGVHANVYRSVCVCVFRSFLMMLVH